jgi:ribosomal protein S6--L-glutamate ligase
MEFAAHEVRVIDVLRCYMNITSHRPEHPLQGRGADRLRRRDPAHRRLGDLLRHRGAAPVRDDGHLPAERVGRHHPLARQAALLQLLSRKGIGLPVTGFAHVPDDIEDLIKMVGGAPLVIKLLEGTQGIGVVLAETEKAAESVIEAFMGLKANILVQEYIKEAGGADIRCFVIGDKVVAAMKRQGKAGEFRSNLHRGGSAS